LKVPWLSNASMKASTPSTRRAWTATLTANEPSGSRLGWTAVIRTSSGNATSNRENSSVQENARRSMMALASVAAADTVASSAGSMRPRICAASRVSRCASVSACTASALRRRCSVVNLTNSTRFAMVATTTMTPTPVTSARTARAL